MSERSATFFRRFCFGDPATLIVRRRVREGFFRRSLSHTSAFAIDGDLRGFRHRRRFRRDGEAFGIERDNLITTRLARNTCHQGCSESCDFAEMHVIFNRHSCIRALAIGFAPVCRLRIWFSLHLSAPNRAHQRKYSASLIFSFFDQQNKRMEHLTFRQAALNLNSEQYRPPNPILRPNMRVH